MSRAEFVRRILAIARRRGDIPLYGSDTWEALDLDDPRRFAAVVAAAECWRRDGEPDAIAARIDQELADIDLYVRYRLSEASRDVSRGYVYDGRPSWRELQRRRAEQLGVEVEAYGSVVN